MGIVRLIIHHILHFFRQDYLSKRFSAEANHFLYLTRKYNASVNTDNDMEKMQYSLLRENHVIEKGMSLRNPRKGFGQEKVMALIRHLFRYADKYANADIAFLRLPLETIAEYIDFTKNNGFTIHEIEKSFESLCEKCGFSPKRKQGGVTQVVGKDLKEAARGNFESLLLNRHSIRYFKRTVLPSKLLIEQALELAQRTPSACNRQAWKTHVYFGADSVNLVKWQGGCRGFEDEIMCSIVVTSNLKAFLWHEVHQAYIDGGLYAMNLINALYCLGLGSIPLSLGFNWEKLKELVSFGIPENEVPIVIIGCGEMEDSFHVAISKRKGICLTNTFH